MDANDDDRANINQIKMHTQYNELWTRCIRYRVHSLYELYISVLRAVFDFGFWFVNEVKN